MTADCNGVAVLIKPTATEKLNSDFIFPNLKLKDYVEPTPNKTPNITKTKSPDNTDNKYSDSIKKNTNLKAIKDKTKKPLIKTDKTEVILDQNKVASNIKDINNTLNKLIYQPVGSNFE